MRPRYLCIIAAIGLSIGAGISRAGEFSLSATGTSSSASANGSSVPNLVDNLINAKNQFQSLNGQDFTAALKYGKIDNALLFSENAAGTSATLSIPSTGFSKTFVGANSDDLQSQIKDFLVQNGVDAYAKFLRVINEQSLLGVVDGNPRATTAIMSDYTFDAFGIHRTPVWTDQGAPRNAISNFRLDVKGGYGDNDDTHEGYVTGDLQAAFTGETVGLTLATIGNYRDIEGSSYYNLGFEIGLPIQIVRPSGTRGFVWCVTPTASVSGGLSYDAAAGGTMWGAGLTSSLGYRIGPWLFTMANQITYYDGFTIDIGNYKFNTDVNQEVLKNGVDIAYSLGFGAIDASVTYTNFLQEAAIDGYWTPSVGISFKFNNASGIRIAYEGDFANDYTSNGGTVELYFGY